MLHSLKTEETAFKLSFGQELFPYLTEHPAAAAVFDEAMTNYTMQVAAAIVAAYDFSQFGTLVDVGGGYGTLLTAILQAQSGPARGPLSTYPTWLKTRETDCGGWPGGALRHQGRRLFCGGALGWGRLSPQVDYS